jgi:hypothetical protein
VTAARAIQQEGAPSSSRAGAEAGAILEADALAGSDEEAEEAEEEGAAAAAAAAGAIGAGAGADAAGGSSWQNARLHNR